MYTHEPTNAIIFVIRRFRECARVCVHVGNFTTVSGFQTSDCCLPHRMPSVVKHCPVWCQWAVVLHCQPWVSSAKLIPRPHFVAAVMRQIWPAISPSESPVRVFGASVLLQTPPECVAGKYRRRPFRKLNKVIPRILPTYLPWDICR